MVESKIEGAVADLFQRNHRLVLAVSGGIDSMVLLDAAGRVRPSGAHIVVATIDHGTGPAARRAAALVTREAERRGLAVRVERLAPGGRATEASWREARWRVLRTIAATEDARIVTAHTRDDQLETVIMRILRGAGARGLAGLAAPSEVLRPLLPFSRAQIAEYAGARGVPFVEDPLNWSRRFLRNRVRHDLLPAILRVRPGFDAELLALAERAAQLRRDIDDVAARMVVTRARGSHLVVDADALHGMDAESVRLLWPALAGMVGLALDRRGIERLMHVTHEARIGSRAPVSGGWEVVRGAHSFTLRRPSVVPTRDLVPLAPGLRFGRFRFQTVTSGTSLQQPSEDPWQAVLPRDVEIMVRAWAPGDRMEFGAAGARRRVKRFFADAHIAGPLREGWPVVLVDGQIAWIPGVRHAPVAAGFAGQASIVYRCESDSL